MTARPRRPRDPNQLAALIVGISTGEIEDHDPHAGKDPVAIKRGQKGGVVGGKGRMATLTAEERKALGLAAARKRWDSRKPK